MPRFITPPDLISDRSIPKVFIRNCSWDEDLIHKLLSQLSEKNYDIYLYNDSMNDIQWAEGIRTQSVKVFDCNHYAGQDPMEWLGKFDNEFRA